MLIFIVIGAGAAAVMVIILDLYFRRQFIISNHRTILRLSENGIFFHLSSKRDRVW